MDNPVPYEDFQLTTTWDDGGDNWLYAPALTELAYEFNRRMTSIGQEKIAFPHVGTGDDTTWWQYVAGVSPIKIWHDVLTEMYAEFNVWKGAGNYYDETRYFENTYYGIVRWNSGADATTTTYLAQLATKKTLDIIYRAWGEMKTAINNMYASHDAWTVLSCDYDIVQYMIFYENIQNDPVFEISCTITGDVESIFNIPARTEDPSESGTYLAEFGGFRNWEAFNGTPFDFTFLPGVNHGVIFHKEGYAFILSDLRSSVTTDLITYNCELSKPPDGYITVPSVARHIEYLLDGIGDAVFWEKTAA